jgi:uncharacterized protein (TIGR02466 family)
VTAGSVSPAAATATERMVFWESIFPTPVMRSNIGRNFAEEELAFFEKMWGAARTNVTNFRSDDTHVLDAPEMGSLRGIVQEHVNQFGWKIISADPKHTFYITQSWVNFTQPGQSHFRHMHTNSLISGSIYVYVKKEADSICFYRNSGAQILVTDDQTNPFNTPIHRVPVDVGDLVLFPSSLLHDVEPTTGAHIRVSLAFNAFIKGELGSEQRLNRLVI